MDAMVGEKDFSLGILGQCCLNSCTEKTMMVSNSGMGIGCPAAIEVNMCLCCALWILVPNPFTRSGKPVLVGCGKGLADTFGRLHLSLCPRVLCAHEGWTETVGFVILLLWQERNSMAGMLTFQKKQNQEMPSDFCFLGCEIVTGWADQMAAHPFAPAVYLPPEEAVSPQQSLATPCRS